MTKTLAKLACLAVLALGCTAADPVLPPPLPATTAAAGNTTSVSGTVLAGGKPLIGAVVWLRVPDGQGGFGPDLRSYPITAQHGYTFGLTAGTWQLHVFPPAGYAVAGDNPLTITTAAGLPATVNFAVVPVATAAATPATPTTRPVGTFVLGLAGDVTSPVYTAAPAPATVHVNSLCLQGTPGQWMGEGLRWDFGCPGRQPVTDPTSGAAVDLDAGQRGPAAAYLYESPGTYTVTLTRTLATGQVLTYPRTVVVPPAARTTYYLAPAGSDANAGTDPAHPLATVAAVAGKLRPHTAVLFARGGTYTFTADLAVKQQDLLLDCYGDPAQPYPVLARANPTNDTPDHIKYLDTWPGQTVDVTVRHVRFACPFTTTAAGDRLGCADVCTVRGTNVTFADCELETVAEGPECDGSLTGGLYLRVVTLDDHGVASRTLWLEGHDVEAVGCVGLGSSAESCFRAAATGVTGGAMAYCTAAQPGTGKGSVTLRTLADFAFYGNHVVTSAFALDPRTAAANVARTVVTGNVFDDSDVTLKPNCRDVVVSGNAINGVPGPAINVVAGDGVTNWSSDVLISGNRVTSPTGSVLKVVGGAPGLVRLSDDGTNVLVRAVAATRPAE